MPISSINPDGSVRIFNSNTGEVKTVMPEELGQYSPKLVGEYEQHMADQQKVQQVQQAQTELAKSGGLSQSALDKISTDDPELALKLVQQNVKPRIEPTAAEAKKKSSAGAVENLINNLEQHYQDSGAGETNLGPLTRILGLGKSASAKVGMNKDAALYDREKAGFAAALKQLSGDTGVLTDQDYDRLAGLLPGLGSTRDEAKGLFKDLRSQAAATYGQEQPSKSKFDPKEKGLLDVILSGPTSIAKDAGASITANLSEERRNASTEQAFAQASILERAAQKVSDPKRKKELLQKAAELYQSTGRQADEVRSSFSENINDNYAMRAITGAVDIAGAAELPALTKAGINLFKNPVTATTGPKTLLDKVFTQDTGSKLRAKVVSEASKSGKTIRGDDLAQGVMDWAETALKANPGKEKQIQKIATSAIDQFGGKSLTPDDAFKIWSLVDSGFSQAGVTKSSIEAASDRALRGTLRQQLEKVAPGFEEGTKLIKKGLDRSKTAKSVGKIAGGSAIGLATTAGLLKLLGIAGVDTKN